MNRKTAAVSCILCCLATSAFAEETKLPPETKPGSDTKADSNVNVKGADDNYPVTPEVMPKVFDRVDKLWEVPIPDPVLDAPTPAPAPVVVKPAAQSAQASEVEMVPAERDPITRNAMLSAATNADSLIDGVGGIAAPLDVAYLPAKGHPPGSGFVFGPGLIFPTLSFGASYQKRSRGSDQPFQATAGGALSFAMGIPGSGKTMSFSYGAQARIPEEAANNRLFDQQLSFRAGLGFTKLQLGVGVTYSGLSGVSRDLGRADDRDLLTVSSFASYELSVKSSLDVDVSVPIREYSDGVDSAGISTTGFYNLRYSPKFTIGLGVGGGVLKVQGGGSQTFGQVLTRLSLASSEVMSFFGTAGGEFREAGDSQKVIPVFGLGASWTPRLGTSFTLTADRRAQNSATATNVNFVTTSVALTVAQRLGSRMGLQVSAGFEDASYYSLNSAVSENRNDRLYSLGASLNAQVTKHVTLSLQYAFSENNSALESFDDSRGQFQLNYNF